MVVCECGRSYKPKVPGHIRCLCGKTIYDDNFKIHQDRENDKTILKAIELSRKHWAILHSYAVDNKHSWDKITAQEFYNNWEGDIPSIGCGCKNNWKELKKTLNLDNIFDTPENFFKWSVNAHNAVNKKLSKRIVSYEEARQLHGF